MNKDRKIYCGLTTAIVVLSVLCIYGFTQLRMYKNQVTASYRRAFTELTGYVNNIDVNLTKAVVTTNQQQLSNLADKLWLYSAFAKENLGLLPVASSELDNTSNFLSQVGDYTYSLTKKISNGEGITDDELSQLHSLLDYSATLSAQLLTMEEGVMNGEIPIGSTDGILNKSVEVFSSDLNEIEEKFSDYTSLIYDGPFSEHNERGNGDFLNGDVVSKEQAQQKVKEFMGSKASEISFAGESNSVIPTYDFNIKASGKDRNIYVKVSKNGGYIVMMMDSKKVENVVLEYSEAATIAQKFLIDNGYIRMKQTGYIIEGNSIVFAYAYVQNEFVMYPDLIKVKIALDNGEIIGLEANGFISNHIESRKLPMMKVTKEEAAAKMNRDFSIKSINKALIPLDTGKEVYCYEIKGTCNDKTFLVYINTETGEEENIQMLVETQNGALTI